MDVDRVTELSAGQRADLHRLFADEWWTRDRTPADVSRMLEGSDVVVGLADPSTGELLAFARALTDGVYKALVFDVIVAEAHRGGGLGTTLLDVVLDAPGVADAEHVELYCRAELVPFYERWGFSTDVEGVWLLRREGSREFDPSVGEGW